MKKNVKSFICRRQIVPSAVTLVKTVVYATLKNTRGPQSLLQITTILAIFGLKWENRTKLFSAMSFQSSWQASREDERKVWLSILTISVWIDAPRDQRLQLWSEIFETFSCVQLFRGCTQMTSCKKLGRTKALLWCINWTFVIVHGCLRLYFLLP